MLRSRDGIHVHCVDGRCLSRRGGEGKQLLLAVSHVQYSLDMGCSAATCSIAVTVAGETNIAPTDDAIAAALAAGPVIVNVDAGSIAENYRGGILHADEACGNSTVPVLLVGHGAGFWVVRGIWGKNHLLTIITTH